MSSLKLADAKSIIAAAFSRAAEIGLTRPLSVAVLDAGGHLIAFERQDRSSMLRFEIALARLMALWRLELDRARWQR